MFGSTIEAGERGVWRRAATLQDLGDLTARWLSGELHSQPGYYGPVDIDQDDAPAIGDGLRALCRAGMVTISSQAGWEGPGVGDKHVRQIPAVEGFATRDTLQTLRRRLPGWVLVHEADPVRRLGARDPGVPVTFLDGDPFTVFGGSFSRADFRLQWHGAGARAVRQVRAARLVTFTDPGWSPARNGGEQPETDLWQVLLTAARQAGSEPGPGTADRWQRPVREITGMTQPEGWTR